MLYNLDSLYKDGRDETRFVTRLQSCRAIPEYLAYPYGRVALTICVGIGTIVTLYTSGDKLDSGDYLFFIDEPDSRCVKLTFGAESSGAFKALGEHANKTLNLHKKFSKRAYTSCGDDAPQSLHTIFNGSTTTTKYWEAILSMTL